MGLIDEFKTFALKGNVADMAIGVIIGAAFGKIVSSVVNDILMPPIGMLIGGMDFTKLNWVLKKEVLDPSGKIIHEAVTINYGNFIQTTIDFLIVAIAIFILIKAMNRLVKQKEKPPVVTEPTAQEKLLAEIRDILKKNNKETNNII